MRAVAAALAVLATAPVAAAPRGVEGNGQVTSEDREVPPFEGVRLETTADVVVRVGPGRAVRVKVDGNLQPLLRTDVKEGVLVLRTRERIHPKDRPRVEVDTPVLRRFALEGHGNVAIAGGAGDLDLAVDGAGDLRWRGEATSLRVMLDGSGDVTLAGRAGKLVVKIDGAGDVDAARLVAHDVVASIEGSGDVDVTMDGGSLVASVSGSGDVRWRGEASVQRAAVSGSGEILHLE